MPRQLKLAFALGLALALHVALLFVAAPGIDGLASPPEAAPAADAVGEPATSVAPETDPQKPLDIGWDAPPEEPVAEPPPPRPVVAKAAAVVSKPAPAVPAPKPQAQPVVAAAKPAPKPGNGGTVIAADSSYANLVRQHLARYAGALPPGANGEARVQFVVQPDGQVSDVRLVRQSGHSGLDSLALNLPTMAQPLPLPGAQPQRLEVPVQAVAASP